MDALSDVLSSLHLTSAFYCRSELTAPWGLRFPEREVATFHAVRRGTCHLSVDGEPSDLRLGTGDLVILPQRRAHSLVDAPGSPTADILAILADHRPEAMGGPLRHGGGGAATTLLCGSFHFDRIAGPHALLGMLPPLILVRAKDGREAPWLEATLALMAQESATPRTGSEAVLTRAADILLIQAIRAHLDGASRISTGWLRGLSDARIAKALAAIHRQPEHAWRVSSLAKVANMSRSSFCDRFCKLVGEAPHSYLARWRMHIAAASLREERESVKEIAARVGFSAEAAFGTAFKRHFGVSPGAYRREASDRASNVQPLASNLTRSRRTAARSPR